MRSHFLKSLKVLKDECVDRFNKHFPQLDFSQDLCRCLTSFCCKFLEHTFYADYLCLSTMKAFNSRTSMHKNNACRNYSIKANDTYIYRHGRSELPLPIPQSDPFQFKIGQGQGQSLVQPNSLDSRAVKWTMNVTNANLHGKRLFSKYVLKF